MNLNPKKCVFRISLGKLLSYMVSAQGIDANPNEVKAIKQLQPSQSQREIHKLVGMMAAFNRFISKSGEREMSSTFKSGEHKMSSTKLLRKADVFQWDD
jgi:hypothetical protein